MVIIKFLGKLRKLVLFLDQFFFLGILVNLKRVLWSVGSGGDSSNQLLLIYWGGFNIYYVIFMYYQNIRYCMYILEMNIFDLINFLIQ